MLMAELKKKKSAAEPDAGGVEPEKLTKSYYMPVEAHRAFDQLREDTGLHQREMWILVSAAFLYLVAAPEADRRRYIRDVRNSGTKGEKTMAELVADARALAEQRAAAVDIGRLAERPTGGKGGPKKRRRVPLVDLNGGQPEAV